MAEDLPEISQDPNAPLPQVDPNSDLVPYRMERTDPGQAPVVTTGYGPRARPPIQPPAGFGGGVGIPGLDQIYQAAFSKLPVDEAVKAVEAATRYIGLRGYNQALQRGEPADKALAQYGPMILKSGVGIPEALTAQMQRERMTAPPTPQQLIQNRLNQQKFEAAQASAKAKEEAATRMTPYQQAEIDLRRNPPTKPQASKPTPMSEADKEALKDAYSELNEYRKAGLTLNPRSKKDKAKLDDLEHKMVDVRHRIEGITKPPDEPPTNFAPKETQAAPVPSDMPNPAGTKETPKVTTKAQYDALKSGDTYIGKDGKKYRKP